MRKENPRMDIASRERFDKSQLFRFVIVDGVVTLDRNSSMPGRGYYLYKSKEAIEKAKRKRMLSRYGRLENEEEFFENLLCLLNEEGR